MKTLLYILGGQAVGKMTVGEEIQNKTNLKLFHNHMTVELANHFYGFFENDGSVKARKYRDGFSDLRDRLRYIVFDNIGRSPLEGIIFTAAMAYDILEDWEIVNKYTNIFIEAAKSIGQNVRVLVVELKCDLEERYKRNESPYRLEKKPSKRNIEWTKNDIKRQVENYRVVLDEDEYLKFNADDFLSIDNTNLTKEEVADIIIKKFKL